ncbi:ral guanine nucleotide dissociation stimulator-like 2 isoform X2 [Bombina bombina]|uniref:ral guanine nucleotide dissociation stimulator-like 2 isoform X2 n=1 Tax=Bombina bombina TaxID=8345 RepID=UPI00235AEF78|nr:ral guanine nucleotide dissociation stimulator-like 2 isoform X2 [Bombina bombina]
MIPRNLRITQQEERRGHKARDANPETLQYVGEEEEEGVVYSLYLRSSSTQQTPTRVLTLRAGTLPKLVLHLLKARVLGDTSYIPVFLATYRAFSSTSEVLSILLDRLQDEAGTHTSDNHEWNDDDISSLFCGWMSQYPEDFVSLDSETRQRLSLRLSKLSITSLGTKLQGLSVAEKNGPEPNPGAAEESALTDPLEILTYLAAYVAEQLTSIEASLFLRVVPFECLGSVWSRRDRGREHCHRCRSVRETVRHFNQLSGAVTDSCVRDPNLKPQQRARVIEKWVRVAEECWSLRNFSSVYAILSALQSTAVHRLKRVWAEISREVLRSYQEMSDVFSERDNYTRMRELLFQSQDTSDVTSKKHPPRSKDPRASGVVPYLGVFLTDLVMLDSAIRDQLENGYLNFEKRRKEFESLSQIRLLQSVCLGYRLTSDPQFVSWFQGLKPLNETECYRLSCDIEPTQDVANVPTPAKPTVIITHCTELLASIAAPFGPGLHLVSWDTPSDRLMLPGLTQQQKSPSVPTLDLPNSPKGFLSSGRTHRRSASCGSPINAPAELNLSPNSASDPSKSHNPTSEHRIIRARVEPTEINSVYKSVLISSQEKAPAIIDRILRKHHMSYQGSHELVQLLPGGKELVIPGKANVYYAMSSASLDFVVRPIQAVPSVPSPESRHPTRAQISATFPKVKAKAEDLARALF